MSGLFQKGKAWGWAGLIFVVCWAAGAAHAAEWFVATNGNDAAAGTNWETAKLTIQAAIDAAVSNDTVWVSNGVYATGGRAVYGAMTNRVVIDKPITVQSVNGPAVTVIQGAWHPGTTNGDTAVRCVYVGTNAVLSGFTLTNGATRTNGVYSNSREQSGGGAWCEPSGMLSNCVLSGNSANSEGGGSYGGTLNNCTLAGNLAAQTGGGSCTGRLNRCLLVRNTSRRSGGGTAGQSILSNCMLFGNMARINGGGSDGGVLNNCTLICNIADQWGGGAYECKLNNCIVYYNVARQGSNYTNYMGTNLNYCCTTPMPSGTGNITNEPMLASASHLFAGSPCIGAGNGVFASGTDIDGEAWLDPPSMGCDEVRAGSITGALDVAIWAAVTNMSTKLSASFHADIYGRATRSEWQWGDGTGSTNRPCLEHTFSTGGFYDVVLIAYNDSFPLGVAATVTVQAIAPTVHYVDISNATPLAPFSSWKTAATNIQDAIDAVPRGGSDLVLVSNGVYATGGRPVGDEKLTNRIVIDEPITVRSVNGPGVTIIRGAKDPDSTNGIGDAAVRCIYVVTNAILSGFTLTNGATLNSNGNGVGVVDWLGGGASCVPTGILTNVPKGILTNCVLTGNIAFLSGGGSCGGTLDRCLLIGNSAASQSGGGSAFGTLNNCLLTGNSAPDGGGSSGGILNNCLLTGNSADRGGGSEGGILNNCTLTSNSATTGCGGSWNSVLYNCIVYFNTAPTRPNYLDYYTAYSCTTPMPSGTGNITNNPQFVDAAAGNYRLKTNSPCIDRGSNALAQGTADLDGNPRILNGVVDMGAYETQLYTGFRAWAAAITNGLTNDADCAAGDGMPNLLRYVAGGHPTEADGLARLDLAFENGVPALCFNRNTNATDVTLVIQGADEMSDGAAWRDLATNVNGSWGGAANVSESGPGNPVACAVQDPVPLFTNRFLRLKVTRP